MQSSYWGYWLVLMGVAIVGLMISVNGLTTTSTQDHYAVQEIVEASMLESIDYGYYRDYNEVKMNKEKFMEVFTRMLAESMTSTDTYEINFYEMYEAPPKVSVEVKSHSGTNFISTSDYDVTTRVDAIVQIHAEEVRNSNNNNNSGNNNNNNNSNRPQTGTDNNQGNNNQDINVRITNKSAVNNMKVNDTVKLNVTKPSDSVCSWSTDNTGVATVTSDGRVTIHGNGVANITVKCDGKSDSVQIIIDDSTGACKLWLESFEINGVQNGRVSAGRTYTAVMKYVIQRPSGNTTGTCLMPGDSGIKISEAIGLNENTGIYNSAFEDAGLHEVELPPNQEAEIEVEMKFRVPSNYTSGKEIYLNALVSGSNEKQLKLIVN